MPQQGSTDPSVASKDRLDGWKEIAEYIGRTVRTAQRWEHDYGLPVHRIQAANGEIVFAFRTEIDRWRLLKNGREAAAPAASDEGLVTAPERLKSASAPALPGRRRKGPRVIHVWGAGLGVTTAVLLAAYAGMLGARPTLSSDRRLTRPQGQNFQFRGDGLTAGGSVTRWTRLPNGNEETMSSPLIAERDGSVRWALTTDCRTETGTHDIWMVDEGTKRRTNRISLVVLRNPECSRPAADLTPGDVAVDRTTVRPGEKVEVTFTLWNLGSVPAVSTATRLRLGMQSTRTGPGDRALGDHPTPGLAAGQSRKERARVVIPVGVSPGIYYVWVVADNGMAIIEQNSHNNFARSEALAVHVR